MSKIAALNVCIGILLIVGFITIFHIDSFFQHIFSPHPTIVADSATSSPSSYSFKDCEGSVGGLKFFETRSNARCDGNTVKLDGSLGASDISHSCSDDETCKIIPNPNEPNNCGVCMSNSSSQLDNNTTSTSGTSGEMCDDIFGNIANLKNLGPTTSYTCAPNGTDLLAYTTYPTDPESGTSQTATARLIQNFCTSGTHCVYHWTNSEKIPDKCALCEPDDQQETCNADVTSSENLTANDAYCTNPLVGGTVSLSTPNTCDCPDGSTVPAPGVFACDPALGTVVNPDLLDIYPTYAKSSPTFVEVAFDAAKQKCQNLNGILDPNSKDYGVCLCPNEDGSFSGHEISATGTEKCPAPSSGDTSTDTGSSSSSSSGGTIGQSCDDKGTFCDSDSTCLISGGLGTGNCVALNSQSSGDSCEDPQGNPIYNVCGGGSKCNPDTLMCE